MNKKKDSHELETPSRRQHGLSTYIHKKSLPSHCALYCSSKANFPKPMYACWRGRKRWTSTRNVSRGFCWDSHDFHLLLKDTGPDMCWTGVVSEMRLDYPSWTGPLGKPGFVRKLLGIFAATTTYWRGDLLSRELERLWVGFSLSDCRHTILYWITHILGW